MDLIYLSLGIFVCGSIIIMALKVRADRQAAARKRIRAAPRPIRPTREHLHEETSSGVVVDEGSNLIGLIGRGYSPAQPFVIDYADLSSVEMLEDGNVAYSSSGSTQSSGGTATLVTSSTVNQVQLRLYTRHPQRPQHDVFFLTTPTKRDGPQHVEAFDAAAGWQALLSTIIRLQEAVRASSSSSYPGS